MSDSQKGSLMPHTETIQPPALIFDLERLKAPKTEVRGRIVLPYPA